MEDLCRAEWKEHVLPSDHLHAVRTLARSASGVSARLADAVGAAREAGASWQEIGEAAEMTLRRPPREPGWRRCQPLDTRGTRLAAAVAIVGLGLGFAGVLDPVLLVLVLVAAPIAYLAGRESAPPPLYELQCRAKDVEFGDWVKRGIGFGTTAARVEGIVARRSSGTVQFTFTDGSVMSRPHNSSVTVVSPTNRAPAWHRAIIG